MVKLRFARMGKKNRPHYRLCAMDSRRPRDGKYLEWLGVYDPLIRDDAKKAVINKERVEYWLRVGAQPSETVYSFLKDNDVQGLVRLKKPKHKRPRATSAKAQPAAASTRKPKPPKKAKPPKGGAAASGSPEGAN